MIYGSHAIPPPFNPHSTTNTYTPIMDDYEQSRKDAISVLVNGEIHPDATHIECGGFDFKIEDITTGDDPTSLSSKTITYYRNGATVAEPVEREYIDLCHVPHGTSGNHRFFWRSIRGEVIEYDFEAMKWFLSDIPDNELIEQYT